MDLHVWATFAAACLVLALVPGPGVATIVGFAFSSGRRAALASVAGMAIGNMTAISVSLAGAGALLASSAFAFAILKWAGALYLIVLGVLAIRNSATRAPASPPRPAIGPRSAFFGTMVVGVLHPKTILFFVAFASQFIRPDAAYLPQAAILVVTFTLIAAITDTLYALGAARVSTLLGGQRLRIWGNRAGGATLIAAGLATATLRR